MGVFYYDLNSKTRVCSCHRHPGCKTIPEENKEEAELIWSLVNYDASRKGQIKTTLTKWLTSVNHPGINLMYKKDKRILELVGGTIIHLIYILDNECILLLNNLPASWQHLKIAAKYFTVILQYPDAVDIAFQAERPLAIMTALSFVFVDYHMLPKHYQRRTAHKYFINMYDFQKLSGMCPKEQSYIGKVSDLVQYIPISYTIASYIRDGFLRKLFKTPSEALSLALTLHEDIPCMIIPGEKVPPGQLKYSFGCLEHDIENAAGIQPKESWIGLLILQLEILLQKTIDKFWFAELKDKQQHYKAACDIVLLMYSEDKNLRTKANSTAMCHFSPLLNFLIMVWCPNMQLTEQEHADNHNVLKKIWFALDCLLHNLCQHQYQDENICLVRNISTLIVNHNCFVTTFLLLVRYLVENVPDLRGWKVDQMPSIFFSFVIQNKILNLEYLKQIEMIPKPSSTASLGPYFNSFLRGSLGQQKKLIKIDKKDMEDRAFMTDIQTMQKELQKEDHSFLDGLQPKGIALFHQLWKESYLLQYVDSSSLDDLLKTRIEIIDKRILQSSTSLIKSFKSYKSGETWMSSESQLLLKTIKKSLYKTDLLERAENWAKAQVQDEPAIPQNSDSKTDDPLKSSPEENPSAKAKSEASEELDPEYILSPEMIKELRDLAIEDMNS